MRGPLDDPWPMRGPLIDPWPMWVMSAIVTTSDIRGSSALQNGLFLDTGHCRQQHDGLQSGVNFFLDNAQIIIAAII